jgi:hypothetical protein
VKICQNVKNYSITKIVWKTSGKVLLKIERGCGTVSR